MPLASEYAADFVLKGGVLMAAFAHRRPTRDIDLAALGISNDIADVENRVRSILGEARDDGITFDRGSAAGEVIRDDADYPGVRVKIAALLASAQVALHVDVNFGDPIWPGPAEAEIPLLLGGTLHIRGYPDHMVLAEKIVTAIDRGEQNSRWRDFVDIAAITATRRISYVVLHRAIEEVAHYRQVRIEPLTPLLQRMPGLAQRRWAIWRGRQHLEASTPERFSDLLEVCVAFADGVLDGTVQGGRWEPGVGAWIGSAGG